MTYTFKKRKRYQILLLLGDIFIIVSLLPLSFYLRGYIYNIDFTELIIKYHYRIFYYLHQYTGAMSIMLFIYLSTFYIGELYDLRLDFSKLKGFIRILLVVVSSIFLISLNTAAFIVRLIHITDLSYPSSDKTFHDNNRSLCKYNVCNTWNRSGVFCFPTRTLGTRAWFSSI